MSFQLRIAGPQSHIERFRAGLTGDEAGEEIRGAEIGRLLPLPRNPFAPLASGIEPLTYFIVAYGAHLAADLTKEAAREWLKSRASKAGLSVEVSQYETPAPPALPKD